MMRIEQIIIYNLEDKIKIFLIHKFALKRK